MEPKNLTPANACACSICVSACRRRPGIFTPDQIAPLAERMGVTVQQLFDERLSIDWWQGDEEFFILMPANGSPGEVNDYNPLGRCTFLNGDDRCEIHALGKPAECAAERMCEPGDGDLHERMARTWDKPEHQEMIRQLYGHQPGAPEVSLYEMLMVGR